MPLTPPNFRYSPNYFGENVFGPGFFLPDVVLFQSKEVWHFFGPWTTLQENESSVLCDVISRFHSRAKQAQNEESNIRELKN